MTLPMRCSRTDYLQLDIDEQKELALEFHSMLESRFRQSEFGYTSFPELDYDQMVLSSIFYELNVTRRIESIGSMTFRLAIQAATPSSNMQKEKVASLSASECLEIACDPESPPDLLEALAESDNLDVVIELAKNPSTPASALHLLDGKWFHFERSPRFLWGHFIFNPNCPGDILRQIARQTSNSWARERARKHPNFPLQQR